MAWHLLIISTHNIHHKSPVYPSVPKYIPPTIVSRLRFSSGYQQKTLLHLPTKSRQIEIKLIENVSWRHHQMQYRFPRYWPFVRGIHWLPMNSPHKASDAELWYFICSSPEYLKRHCTHYDFTLMWALCFQVAIFISNKHGHWCVYIYTRIRLRIPYACAYTYIHTYMCIYMYIYIYIRRHFDIIDANHCLQ